MLKGEDIKRLVKNAENWQVEFKLAKGGVPDTFGIPYPSHSGMVGGRGMAMSISKSRGWDW